MLAKSGQVPTAYVYRYYYNIKFVFGTEKNPTTVGFSGYLVSKLLKTLFEGVEYYEHGFVVRGPAGCSVQAPFVGFENQ